MTDPLREKIEKLRIMRESASRRSALYSDMGKLDDKKTSQSLGALNRASAPGKKNAKIGIPHVVDSRTNRGNCCSWGSNDIGRQISG